MSDSRTSVLQADGISGRVGVEFELQEGRYSHDIWLVVDGERIPVFKSVENPTELHLPCFTELHQQGMNLFLTGANGPCHWSMSVEVGDARFRAAQEAPSGDSFPFDDRYGLNAPGDDTGEVAFRFLYFDVACRMKEPVPGLGTVYSRAGALEHLGKFTSSSGRLWQKVGFENAELTFGANPEVESMRFDPDPQCVLSRESGDRIFVTTAKPAAQSYPATVQWSYGYWA